MNDKWTSPQWDCPSSSELMSEVFVSEKVNKLQLKWVYAALHRGPECWYKMTNCHQWGRHVPTLRNPTPSGFSLTAKNTSRIWTSIWYHPRCRRLQASASQNTNTKHPHHWFHLTQRRRTVSVKTRESSSADRVGELLLTGSSEGSLDQKDAWNKRFGNSWEQRAISLPELLFLCFFPPKFVMSAGPARSDATELQGPIVGQQQDTYFWWWDLRSSS